MKTWLLVFLLSVAGAISSIAQTPVLESQKEAVRLYPDLADPSSKLNKKFLSLVNATRISDPTFLQRDDWPLVLAKRAAVGNAPKGPVNENVAAARSGNPLERGSQLSITGSVLQRTSDGLLVDTRMRGDGGHVWLYGWDAKVGERVSVPAVKAGAKSYGTVGGAERMIDAYRAVR